MIIIRPSFWGYFVGKNIITPTNISIVPYHNVISIIMTNGLFFSTIHMRIHGITEGVRREEKNEGELGGVWKKDAIRLTRFVEDVIEALPFADEMSPGTPVHGHAKPGSGSEYGAPAPTRGPLPHGVKTIAFDDARKRVELGESRFVWLGSGAIEKIAVVLGVEKSKVVAIDMLRLSELGRTRIEELGGCILVSNDDAVAAEVCLLLKKDFDIDTYVLEGGLRGIISQL